MRTKTRYVVKTKIGYLQFLCLHNSYKDTEKSIECMSLMETDFTNRIDFAIHFKTKYVASAYAKYLGGEVEEI